MASDIYTICCLSHVKVLGVICLLIHLNESYWTNDVICIPTLHGMDDVMFIVFLSCINNWYIPLGWVDESNLVYPHLVGRLMYV